ncbi:LamG domain-containing protein [Novosphingobium sp. 9]|uniref:LamG domain-containing protein n=1 Tax=Novosphingobium sp. 9 TaxID=2025349 RepID=UPI0021B55E70|nr:LamG domain-containing protein [Novosphingobium sp. 9]
MATGSPSPIFQKGVRTIADGASGPALAMDDNLTLAWSAPGNIHAQRGTVSFLFRPGKPLDEQPFPIFRVGRSDGSDWDMTWLRIDWNGHGFDAFVTDTGMARTRLSTTVATIPPPDRWIAVTFAWDETKGVTLWIDGKQVATKAVKADYDMGLWGFGFFQRTVSPWQVQSAYNFLRSGDIDELRIYDHVLDGAEVAALAKGQAPAIPTAPARTLTDPATRGEWAFRHGWANVTGPVDYGKGPVIAVRKVEFADARDQKEKMLRGADGIRETTWPGVYNRSTLPGRDDYFELPDWNVYSTGGRAYTLALPGEDWNHIEITGPAYGTLDWSGDGAKGETVLRRAQGLEQTSTQLGATRHGGTLTFRNVAPETPIQEIGAYDIRAIDAPPQGIATLTYALTPEASPEGYASLRPLTDFIAGRYPADERAVIVALPEGAPLVPADAAVRERFPIASGKALPEVRVLIPATFRDQPAGETARRFSYGWENLDGGLDGLVLRLPALGLKPQKDGLVPFTVCVHDPLWPERDLLDVTVRIDPDKPQTLWLDTRDRILRPEDSLSLSLASADPDFDAAKLQGASVSLVFKPREAALAEHVADRLEQARDELAWLVEEQPSTRLYPVWNRFESDVSDVLRVAPENPEARALWNEKNPEQPYWQVDLAPPPDAKTPLWAWRQVQDLTLYRHFVDWWIDHRQLPPGVPGAGELGGGLSDDTDLVNQWVGLALMGVEPDRLRASQRAVLNATHENGMWNNGLSHIMADQLHSYEEGINTLAQAMMLDRGNPQLIEQAMATARRYPDLIRTNPAGHLHFATAFFNGSRAFTKGPLGWQYPYSYLVTHPGMLLVDWNGAPQVKSLLLRSLNDWLAHGRQDSHGHWVYPQEIEWATDKTRGTGVSSAIHSFWAAWRWTSDPKYLRPIEPKGLAAGSLNMLFGVNADTLAQVPGGPGLAADISSGKVTTDSHAYDPNLGTVSDAQIGKFVRWQETGDNSLLAGLYADEAVEDMHRMYYITEAEAWIDRVAVPSDLLQRARMGGVAHLRNNYYPGNLVSWRFAGPDDAQKVGIMIPHGDPKHFTVIAYNMTDAPMHATMIGGELAPGTWEMRSGIDSNGDNRADAPGAPQTIQLEKQLGTDLTFPAHQTVVYEFTLKTLGDNPATRPDVGLSQQDLAWKGSALQVTVHSLGAKPTPAGEVTITGPDGRVWGKAAFPTLAAPSDLTPKTATISLKIPAEAPKARLAATLRLNGDVHEITADNNTASVPAR